MVEHHPAELDRVFRALAHPVRRSILRRVARGERTMTELAAPFDMSLEAVSKHVQVLERARLLRRARSGREYRCRLGAAPPRDAAKVLAELTGLWNRELDSLERLLAELQGKGAS